MAAQERSNFGRRLSHWTLKHRRTVLILGIVLFIASLPFAALSHTYINYSSTSTAPSGSQSAEVSNLLASAQPQYSTLYVVVPNTLTEAQFCQASYDFNETIASKGISHYNYTSSICSVVATTINALYGSNATEIRTAYSTFTSLSGDLFDYPATFLTAWGAHDYARSEINTTFNETGGQAGYDNAFRASLYQNYSSDLLPSTMVNGAVASNALKYYNSTDTLIILALASVTDYSTPALLADETALALTLSGFPILPSLVTAYVTPGNGGWNFVEANGYSGAISLVPAGDLVKSRYVSSDNSTLLVLVVFTVPDSYRGADNFYPAESATPEVRTLSSEFYGAGAGVTGTGALTYDTSTLTASSEVLFAFTFLFLIIAVLVTLRSFWASVLIVLFVILGFLAGYTAIFIGGVLLGSVNYLVTYVLEAVTLGIVADYLVFILYRYREELRNGTPADEAIRLASETAGTAVLTSASIVAVGLAILSLIPGFESWGLVLFIAVMMIGLTMSLFLPVVASYFGPRIFIQQYMKRNDAPIESSSFYRAASFAIRKRVLIVVIAAIVAVPAMVFLFTAPTSYNINEGLPASLPSVAAQNEVTEAFGAGTIYPTYVLVEAPTGSSFLLGNHTLNPATSGILLATAKDLLATNGVSGATGPFVLGNTTTSALNSSATSFVFDNGARAFFIVSLTANPFSDSAMSVVQSMRGNSSWLVGGTTASLVDQRTQNEETYPIVEGLLVLLIAIILALAFRAVSYPLISLSGVFVSISATFVLLWWISEYILGQVVIYLIPLVLIVILLSLGNDYTVFILSRVAEERQTHEKNVAIPRGLAHSGVVVVSLGLILAVSLGSLALQPISFLEQIGIAFAISLVLDTFLIGNLFFPGAISLFSRERKDPSK